MRPYLPFFASVTLSLASLSSLPAEVRLPAIFGDQMVLQQDARLPVWGWADPGEKVTVTFGDQKAEATAGADGKWQTDLPAVPAGTPPGTLVIAGKNTITISDVLVGDVWVCSGQSNMAFGLNEKQAAEFVDTPIRVFQFPRQLGLVPLDNFKGSWKVQPAKGFTAVGAFFASNLRPVLNRPIGLIESTWGGTPAQAWTALSALEANPPLAYYAEAYKTAAANYPGGQAELEKKAAARDAAMTEWSEKLQADTAYQASLKAWQTALAEANATGQSRPLKPAFPIAQPPGLQVDTGTPSILFNGMIHPLIPYAIKGVIWYQGEANATRTAAFEYRTLFPTMITDWRTKWKQGDFPFLFVQLPNFRPSPKTADDAADWAVLRESQFKALSLPKTGMAVTIDVGSAGNLHPPDKANVGRRLALAARHVAYGEDLAYTGPIYSSMKVEGGNIQLSFQPDSLGGGLIVGSAPGTAAPAAGTDLQGFAIAGDDQKWVWAKAKIDGKSVIVSSPEVSNPVAVRYAWADNPTCNLYNQEGLPAAPFRTDEWKPLLSADPLKKSN